MAFSTTKNLTRPMKAVRVATYTMNDTAGNGAAENFADCDRITIQVTGTFASGIISLQVSNDGTNFVAAPTAVSINAAGVVAVAENSLGFLYYRPVLASGGSTTALTVTFVGSSSRAAG